MLNFLVQYVQIINYMKKFYIIRLDDACPYMDREKWQHIEDILDKYAIKPLVGVIPANADIATMVESKDPAFWEKARRWEHKGWSIALHGYDHVYISDGGMMGLNPFWKRSEFASLSLELQREKIRKGYAVLKEHGFEPKFFFAPSHTFDENTLEALRLETNIRIVSDTIGRYPYKQDDFYFLPQIIGHCANIPFSGIYTFCFHPNMMTDEDFDKLDLFLQNNISYFADVNGITIQNYYGKKLLDRILSKLFFMYRQFRKIQ